MQFEPIRIADARLIHMQLLQDSRGAFVRTWCRDSFAQEGIVFDPVQTNQSITLHRGSIRGMHFQRQPHSESKLVRVTRGCVYDVITDLREHSPTRGLSYSVELSEEGSTILYIPAGCAHGFQTLTNDVSVEYIMGGEPYMPEFSDGFRYDDPAARIVWPLPVSVISERDCAWPPLTDRFPWLRAVEPACME
jgi:dTDP-4-dehydrorhamnose 3,5-epimerase